MKYLVTGGAGFIGSHLVEALAARGDSVVVIDDLSTGSLKNIEHLLAGDAVEFVEGSVVDAELVGDCMASADVCVHLAAAVGVYLIVSRPLESLLGNVRGTDVVLAAAARHGCRLLYASTSEVYGKHSDGALKETSDRIVGSPFVARWSYATAKAFGEALLHGYVRESGADFTAARIFNTVGPRQKGNYGMVLPRFARQALADEDLTVYGTGTQSRCFVHVSDTVRALLLLAETEAATGRVFNVGSSDEIRIIDLATRVIERAESGSRVRLVPYEDAYGEGFAELGRRKPDTTELRQTTSWAPTRSLDEMIDDVVAYERSGLEAVS
jgi:UDP-glucose 4-epimerase